MVTALVHPLRQPALRQAASYSYAFFLSSLNFPVLTVAYLIQCAPKQQPASTGCCLSILATTQSSAERSLHRRRMRQGKVAP